MKKGMILLHFRTFICGTGLGILMFYLFYNYIIVAIPGGILLGIVCLKVQKKQWVKNQIWKETLAFKDVAEAVISALSAGYSMEHAWREAYQDLFLIYEKEHPTMCEMSKLQKKLDMGVALDELLLDWGKRSQVEDIILFAQIYMTARKSGGNLIKILRQTARNISEKVETKREIMTMISGKRLEARCMMGIPLFIILYLRISSPGFLMPLYGNAVGIFFMTMAFICYILGVCWIRRIVDIEC